MNHRIALLLLLLAGASPGPLPASETAWREAVEAGRAAAHDDEAVRGFQAALAEAETFGSDDARHLQTLGDLAGRYHRLGRREEAATLYSRALRILQRLHGADHPRVAALARGLESVTRGDATGMPVDAVPDSPPRTLLAIYTGPGNTARETTAWDFDVTADWAEFRTRGPAPIGTAPTMGVDLAPSMPPVTVIWGVAFAALAVLVVLAWVLMRRLTAQRKPLHALTLEAQQLLERSPRRYKLLVVLLAGLGYLYLAGVMLLAITMLVALIFGLSFGVGAALLLFKTKLFIPLIVLLPLLIRALWVRLPAPQGLEIRRADFPALYAMIDDVRREVRGPRIHSVLLVGELNAGISQVPRLGVLGWQKNYLVLGLQLLLALPPRQFKAILAHEYGHLSGAHGRIAAWVHRVRQTWTRLMLAFDASQHWGRWLFTRFLHWYAPYFNAFSFALARANEYQADAVAARVTSPADTAAALVATSVQARHLHNAHWSPLWSRAAHEAEPPTDAFTTLRHALREPVQERDAHAYVEQAMAVAATDQDTHPSLRDRLAALGEPPRLAGVITESAAETLLHPNLAPLIAQADATWCGGIARDWHEHHERVVQASVELREIEQDFDPAEATPDTCWHRACLIDVVHGDEQALAGYRQVLALDDDHPGANFALGRLLLRTEDRAGIVLLERAMHADIGTVIPGCEVLHGFHATRGEQAAARKYIAWAEDHQRQVDAARAERQSTAAGDVYLPHELPADAVDEIRSQLAKLGFIKHAWLVRKRVLVFPKLHFYVLFFERRQSQALFSSTVTLTGRVVRFLRMPGETLVIEAVDRARRLRRRAAKVDGSVLC